MKATLVPEEKMSTSEKQLLRNRLDEFYTRVTDYTAFETVSDQILCWEKVKNEIVNKEKDSTELIHILEVGAGRSGFSNYLTAQGIRPQVHYSAQDVTKQNASWLESQADNVFYGDVSEIESRICFDIIFSTYVLEHVTDPAAHLDHLYRLLKPGGSLLIFCPRYDVPGYFCPSSRHLSWTTQFKFGLQWSLARISSFINRVPAFLIQTDLSAFHKPFYIDSDAVHWVSLLDLQLWARTKRAQFRSLRLGPPKMSLKYWVVVNWLTCAIRIQKK